VASDQWLEFGGAALLESVNVRHYKELKIWQKGMRLAKSVYQLTATFPADERFGLTAQMRRAAVSVPSNIAEGQARSGTKEFLQFLSHASGSLGELETQILLSADLGYCDASNLVMISNEIGELQKMVAAIRRKLGSGSSH
jgi:four helix bundle protein